MILIILAIILIPLLTFLFYKAHKNTHDIMLNHINMDSTYKTGQRLRVLHISDMHLENISITPDQLYEKLKNEPIDLITLTGDFLDRKRSIPKLVPYLKVFNQLEPKHGIYAVFGNHDYFLRKSNFLKLKEVLDKNGCKTMINENDGVIVNGTKVNIIGIDDFSSNKSDIQKSYNGISEGYNLVLTHDPNIVLKMEDFSFDYLLSGHFHGGQINWPKPYHLIKMGKLVRMNMIKGLQEHGGKTFYISEGLGQTGLNIRVGSRPEITIHHIMIPRAESAEAV